MSVGNNIIKACRIIFNGYILTKKVNDYDRIEEHRFFREIVFKTCNIICTIKLSILRECSFAYSRESSYAKFLYIVIL